MGISLEAAMALAIAEAEKFIGATAPNPPVGAVVLDAQGEVLAAAAHERAGTAHAERKALAACAEEGLLPRVHTVVVTLEPCNHHGRTPPCTEALLSASVKRIVYGARDPNAVASGGAEFLQAAGVEVIGGVLGQACAALIDPFRTRITRGLPWITVKTAHVYAREGVGSMIPPSGKKTFTSGDSLRFAHGLRKRADAILTGSGTVLADEPEFTVRHVLDHPGKKRWLALMDRRRRVPAQWLMNASSRGFEVIFPLSVEDALKTLAENGCLEVLVEAGPTLSREVLARGLWHRHYEIRQGAPNDSDQMRMHVNDNPPGLR